MQSYKFYFISDRLINKSWIKSAASLKSFLLAYAYHTDLYWIIMGHNLYAIGQYRINQQIYLIWSMKSKE